jgi:DNA-binding transcriptional MerR regulator
VPTRDVANGETLASVAAHLSRLTSFRRLAEADLYTIGQLSAHLNVSLRSLRFYEQSGLLRPHRDGTRRLYDRWDLERLRIIVVLREFDTPLGEIKDVMAAIDTGETSRAALARIDGVLERLHRSNEDRREELLRLNERIDAAREGLAVPR